MSRVWVWTSRAIASIVVLLVVLAVLGWLYQRLSERRDLALTPPPGQMVDIGGYRIHIWCLGSGTPAVIMDSGLGGASFGWSSVQPEVAAFTRVCAFDRAGMGYSDLGPNPRTSGQIADELAVLLPRIGVAEPVIVVGASFGGLNARMFATRYADRAAGLVLVDASHEDQGAPQIVYAPLLPLAGSVGLFRILGITLGCTLDASPPSVRVFERATCFRADRFRAMFGEFTGLSKTIDEVRTSRRVLDLPLVVVTRGRDLTEAWAALQRDHVRLSTRGCQMIAVRSGHRISYGQPEVVVNAIRLVWEAAQSHGTPACA